MKKILLTAISFVLVAALAIGGTLAYLTDRDAKTNVFTVGNVDVVLNENFAQGSQLVPGTAVEKNVTVTNTGKNAAWVWVEITVPAELKDVIVLNGNGAGWNVSEDADGKYTAKLATALVAGATTTSVIEEVAFAASVDITPNGDLYTVVNGVTKDLNWNISETPAIVVSAYAIQTENFANVDAAYDAYAGQWGANGGATADVPNVTEVATVDEFKAAVANGGVVVLNSDVELDADVTTIIPVGVATTINLNGNEIVASSTEATTAVNKNVFTVKGSLTVVGEGTMALEWVCDEAAEGWGNSSSVFSVEGGQLTLGSGVTVVNNSENYMAYAVDVNSNGAKNDTVLNINGAVVSSPYTAVRLFNANATYCAVVNVNDGFVDGTKRDIWVHNPSAKAVDANGIVNFADAYETSYETQSASSFYGRIYTIGNKAVATTSTDVKEAIAAGKDVVLTSDVTIAGTAATEKLIMDGDVTLDLNGNTLTTECGWGGIDLKDGASLVNGVINHVGNTAAIKVFNAEKIENVVINVTETAGKTKTGIAIQSGASSVGSIKNVTITGVTTGIECYRTTSDLAIGSMENVKINATSNGIFINGAGRIGSIVNCDIYGGNIGIQVYVANVWHASLDIKSSTIAGGTTGVDIWDEGKDNTGSTVVFNYDAASTFAGSRENIKVTLQEEIVCTINGASQATPCDVRIK